MARTDRLTISCGAPFRAALAFALVLLVLASAASAQDDTDLFTTRVAPNVMLVMDNSGSMNAVVFHRSFRPDAVYDPITCPYDASLEPGDEDFGKCLRYPLCPLVYGESGFVGSSNDLWGSTDMTFRTLYGRTDITKCSNTRSLFIDPVVQAVNDHTRWPIEYLRWYYSDNVEVDDDGDGNTILDEIWSTNNGVTSQCLLNQDPSKPATYGKYRRTRITAGKEILREVICQTSLVADLRYGLAQFYTSSDPPGGYVRVGIDDYTSTHANLLESRIDALEGEAWTPLGETMYNVYRYFQSRTSTRTALGKDGSTRFPVYNISTGGSTSSGTVPPSPVTDDCQQHFVILITDGEPTRDDFDNMNLSNFHDNLIGSYNTPGDADETPPNNVFAPVFTSASCGGDPNDPNERSCEIGLYLDDIAKFMTEHDFQLDPAFPGTQTISTYTVGFSTSGVANAFLQRAADAGDGEFFTSNNPEELAAALTSAINSIVARTKSFTSAAVPASRTTNGDSFYSAYFLPVEDTPFWKGHLKNFDFSATGDILTPTGTCAVGADPNATPPCSAVGSLRTTAEAYWDAATEMPAPYSRKLYVETGSTSMFSQPPVFTMPADPNDAVAAFGIVDNVDELDPPYDTLSPNDPVDIAQAILDTFRGCQFGVTPCDPRLDSNNDPEYLADIFHSNPIVVGSPNSPINESSYGDFANTYRQRTRVIYAGGNGGFLHGFNAGSWQTTEPDGITPLIPPRHDRGTGEELFGFMPYAIRNKAKDILKHVSGLRTEVSVDGSPTVADVWFYRNVSSGNLTTVNPLLVTKQEAQWRTVLMAGLREGGSQYFALDITNPTTAASDASTTYPRYLWGFPCEDCGNATNGGTAAAATYMGESWSEPVITRVRVKAEGGTDPRGYERWVAIFGGGYHEHGDPNGPDYRVPIDAGFTPKGRALFMVDITTGEILAEKHFDPTAVSLAVATGEQVGVREMRYAIASAPAVFDLDFDGFADVVYVGDLGGNVWKWVIKSPGQDPINNTSVDDDPAQPDWPFRLFFRAGTSLEPTLPGEQLGLAYDSTVHYQSFFYPPTGALRQGKVVIAFGAGERANPIVPASEYADGDLSNNNHYYVVKDSDPLEGIGTLPNPLSDALDESDLADFDAATPLTCSQMMSTKQGYFLTARDGEAFVSNSIIFLGTVFTGSFLRADPSASVCDGAGTAFLYAFDLDCGVGKFQSDPGTDADKRRMAIGTGLPTRPRVSVGDLNQGGGGGGCANRVVVVTSDGEIMNDCGGDIDSSGVRVRSWRER
jgi:type IV pilus assembly protein PilY1